MGQRKADLRERETVDKRTEGEREREERRGL